MYRCTDKVRHRRIMAYFLRLQRSSTVEEFEEHWMRLTQEELQYEKDYYDYIETEWYRHRGKQKTFY